MIESSYNKREKSNKIQKIKTNIAIVILIPFLLFGCAYSFTGSSVPNHLKTIYIPFCLDKSRSGEPTMADDFTSQLIDNFRIDNSLSITENPKSDAILECTINSISDAPTVIEGGETVSSRRITIRARVIYKDFVMKKTVFDKTFSNEGDYSTTDGDVSSNRETAIETAIEKITEDILLAVVSDW